MTKLTILHPIFTNESQAIEYLGEKGIFEIPENCPSCNVGRMTLHDTILRCTAKSCRKAVSLLKNSYFTNNGMPVNRILALAFMWVNRSSSKAIMENLGCGPNTVANHTKYLRDMVGGSIQEEDMAIGGPGIIVELDEAKFGKRKYNRGHRVEGAWVFGGVERTVARKMFLVRVEDRTSATLIRLIQRYVRPGSIIMTDCFTSYHPLSEFGYEHMTVNHSISFRNPTNGACTNTIEGTWAGIKGFIPERARNDASIDSYLLEFIWRRKNQENTWDALLEVMADTYFE